MWLMCISHIPWEILKEGTTEDQAVRHREAKQAKIDKERSGGVKCSNSGFVTILDVPVVTPKED